MRAVFLAFCLSGFLASCGPAAQPPQPLDVTVEELAKAYDANEAAAQTAYGGRPLRVTALVKQINLDSDDKPFVNLAGGALLPSQLHFAPDAEGEAAELTAGKTYVFGCADLSEIMGSPMLSGCRLER